MLCGSGVSAQRNGDVLTVLCPVYNFTARYVTVMRDTTVLTIDAIISLQEIEPLYDGGCGVSICGPVFHTHACAVVLAGDHPCTDLHLDDVACTYIPHVHCLQHRSQPAGWLPAGWTWVQRLSR